MEDRFRLDWRIGFGAGYEGRCVGLMNHGGFRSVGRAWDILSLAAQHVGFVPVVQRIVFFTHQADGDDGAGPQIVLDSNGAMGRFEVLPHNGKARPDAPNIVFIGSTAEEKPWHLGLFFRGDAGAMIGEADGVPFVENGDHHLFEARMDEIFGNLPNNGVGMVPPAPWDCSYTVEASASI